MSFNNTRGRHRAETAGMWAAIANSTSGKARTIGSTAAVVAAGSGLMLGMAAPASAGVIANDSAESYSAPAAVAAPVAAPAAAPAASGSTHVVQAGDTLGKIAATYGVNLNDILAQNGLALESIIYPGDVITYAGGAAAAAPVAAAAPAAAYAAPAAAAETADFGSISTQASSVTPAPAAGAAVTGTNQTMLNSAFSQMGAMQDCTVLVEVALRAAGHSVGDLAPAQLAAYGTPVSDPMPGDIIYYADGGMGFAHIAIYIGDGQAIHSGWNGNQTVQQSANVGSGAAYYRVA
ncbi:LysM peptidoglycan-binding domain-containing protein [Arthrobacter sp. Z1-15]